MQLQKQKIKSTLLDLLALFFFIHFFGTLLYVIASNALLFRVTDKVAAHSELEIQLFLCLISVPTILTTAIIERTRNKFYSQIIAKRLFWFWLFIVGIIIVWPLFLPSRHLIVSAVAW